MRRSRLVLMMLVATVLAAAMAGGATGQQAANGPAGAQPAPDPMPFPEAARERAARREAERATPEARRAREASRLRYANQSGDQAAATARRHHGQNVAKRVGPLLDPAAGKLKRFLDDRSALIEDGDRTVVAASTTPLRVDGGPVDLTLGERDGAFRSENPLVAASIATKLAGGITLPDAEIAFSALAGAGDVAPTLLEGKAFWANAVTDTDVVVSPTTGGVQTMIQLRSQASPQELRMPFDLPDGAFLRETEGAPAGYEIVRGEERLAFVAAPIAVDADGFDQPVETSIRGNELVMHVAHRGADVAYPILVDPYVYGMWRFEGSDFWPWIASQGATNGAPFDVWAADDWVGRGLYTSHSNHEHIQFNQGDWALWSAAAPGNSYIDRAEFHDLIHDPEGGTCMTTSIWSASTNVSQSDCVEVMWVDRTLTRPSSGTGPFEMRLQTTIRYTGPRWYMLTFLGGAIFYYSDSAAPTSVQSNAPVGWSNATRYFRASAADAGVGLKHLDLRSPDGEFNELTAAERFSCGGEQSRYCPNTWSGSERNTSALPEGEIYVDMTATDLIGYSQSAPRSTIKTDRTPPVVTQSGALFDAAGTFVTAPKPLHVRATDGTPPLDGSTAERLKARSGVKDVEMLVDGGSVAASMPGAQNVSQSCAAGSCSWEGDFNFDPSVLSEGRHSVQARAIDQIGQSRLEPTFQVYVDRSAPAISFSGPLWDGRGSVSNGTSLTVTATDGVQGGTSSQLRSGVKSIEIRRDGTLIHTSPRQTCATNSCPLTQTITDAAADGPHTYQVTAIDQVGQTSTASFTVTVDRTTPTTPAFSPAYTAWTRDYGYEISSTDAASGVRYLRLKENETLVTHTAQCTGAAATPCPSVARFTKTSTTLPEGENHVSLQAEDGAGNATPYAQHVMKIDRSGPTLQLSGAGSTNPYASAPTKIHVEARDGTAPQTASLTDRLNSRSGVRIVELYVDGAQVRTMNGTQVYDVPCANGNCAASVDLDLDPGFLSEGPHAVTVKATDQVGNTRDSAPINITVDRGKPTLTLSGAMHAEAQRQATDSSAVLAPGNYELLIHGEDPSAGVATTEVLVDGQRVSLDTNGCVPCSMDTTWILHTDGLAPGAHTVQVTITDGAGNTTSSAPLRVTVPDDNSLTARTGGLERYFQYRSIPTGAGTEALVNTGNGNLVWHHRPVYNRGQGLATSVELTYNSLGTLEDLGHGYNEIGDGFSLGISSLTRINEPIDLRALAKNLITITDSDGTVHRFLHSNGKWTSAAARLHLRRYAVDAASNKFWAATRPDGTTYFFDRCGYQRTVEDRHGNRLEYVYSPAPPSAEPGECLPPQAAARPKVIEVLDHRGSTMRANGQVVPQAHKLSLTYWPANALGYKAGRVQEIKDHGGRVLSFDYEPGQGANHGRLLTLTEATGTADSRAFQFGYETSGRDKDLIRVVDPLGQPTRFEYNLDNHMGGAPLYELGERLKSSTNRRQKTTAYEYPDLFADTPYDTKVTDARSKVWQYGADALRRPIHVTDPLGTRTDTAWDTGSNLIMVKEAAGLLYEEATTSMTYNANGRVRTRTDAENRLTEWIYRDGAGVHVSPSGYDAGGTFVSDLLVKKSANGGETRFTLDPNGDVREKTDPEGYRTQWDYEPAGMLREERLERERGKFSRTTYSDFDGNGLPQLMTDARGNATATPTTDGQWKLRYDAIGNVTDVMDPRWGSAPSVTTSRDPYTREFVYDNLDRPILERLPKLTSAGQWIERGRDYDDNDNVVRERDGNTKQTQRFYTPMDQLERLLTPPVPHEGESGDQPEETFLAYDDEENLQVQTGALGRAPGAQAGADTLRITYDDAGRPVVEQRTHATSSETKTRFTSYSYDRRGNVKTAVDPAGNAGVTDPATAIANAGYTPKQRWVYEYDKVDNRIKATEDPGGESLTTLYGYDKHDNLDCVVDPRGADTLTGCATCIPGASSADNAAGCDPATPYRTQFVYDRRDARIAVIDSRGRRTAYEIRGDGQPASVTTPRGTATDDRTTTVTDLDLDFQTRFEYDEEGDLVTRSVPWAPNQYGSKDWKWTYKRNAVGDVEEVTDPRNNKFINRFFDTGHLRETMRPGFWVYDESSDAIRERTDGDPAVNGDPEPSVSTSSNGSGDFGDAAQQPRPDWLPKAGQTTFSYDNEMRLETIQDATGQSTNITTFSRDALGRISRVTRPFGRRYGDDVSVAPSRWTVEDRRYDRHGNLRVLLDAVQTGTTPPPATALKLRATFEYDQFDQRVAATSPGSAGPETTRFTFDLNGNLDFRTTPLNQTWDHGYDRVDREITATDPLGNLTKKGYDDAGNLKLVIPPRGHGSEWNLYATFMTYTSENELSILEEGRTVSGASDENKTTRYQYDADGNRTQVDAPGAQAKAGAPLTRRITKLEYDPRGLVYTQTSAPQLTGSQPAGTPSYERTTVTEYDANGNLRRRVNPAGVTRGTNTPRPRHGAPERDLPTATSQWNEHSTVHEYDADDLLVGTYMPWGAKKLHGTTGEAEDGERWQTKIERDTRGRISNIYAPFRIGTTKPAPTTYRHYENGWVHKSTDSFATNDEASAAPHTLLYDYDARGNQIRWESERKDRWIERQYYDNDMVKSRVARKRTNGAVDWTQSRDTSYAYDPNRSLTNTTEKRFAADGTVSDTRVLTYAYDNAGRQTLAAEKADQHTVYEYDPAGNVSVRWTDGRYTGAATDFLNRANVVSGKYKGGKRTTFSFDDRDREGTMTVQQIDDAGVATAGTTRSRTTTYYGSHDIKTRTRSRPGFTNVEEFRYFADDGRILEILRKRNGAALQPSQKYEYDDATNDSSSSADWGNGNRKKDERGTYVFNSRDQVTRWTSNDAIAAVVDYEVNGSGAIRRKKSGSLDIEYVHVGGRLRYAKEPYGAATPTRTTEFLYDDFGALKLEKTTSGGTTKTTKEHTYDPFERLTGVKGPDMPTVTYTYDPLDRRDTRVSNNSATGASSSTDFRYVGSSERLSREVTSSKASSTATTETGSRFYDYDSSMSPVGQAKTKGTSPFEYRGYAHDASGTPIGLEKPEDGTFDNGEYKYDPYGGLAAEPAGAAGENSLRFQGFAYDADTQEYDMHARTYAPALGRFLTADRYESPGADIGLQMNPSTSDRYTFLGGDPVNRVELDGHISPDSVDRNNDKVEGAGTAVRHGGRQRTVSTYDRASQAPPRLPPRRAAQARRLADKVNDSICIANRCTMADERHNTKRAYWAIANGIHPAKIKDYRASVDYTDDAWLDLLWITGGAGARGPAGAVGGRLAGGAGKLSQKKLRARIGAALKDQRGSIGPFDEFGELAAYRAREGMPPAGGLPNDGTGTAALLKIGDRSFLGKNAHQREVTLRVNAQTKTHAEADVFQQAANEGVKGRKAQLFVDRDLCDSCGIKGGVGSLMRGTGIEELIVHSPSGRYLVTAGRPSVPRKLPD